MHLRLPESIKRFTNPIVGRIPMLITGGVNRGFRWSLAAAGSGYGSGRRESTQMQAIWKLLRDGNVVWDVGSHYGYVALAAARRLQDGGSVHAFEPSHYNHRLLMRHIRWNRLHNVQAHNCAVSDADGTAKFGGGSTSKQHRLGGGHEVVQVRTIQSLIGSGEAAAPTFMKIDVEGAEADILRVGLQHLGSATRLLIAVHSQDVYDQCVRLLREARFEMVESERLRRYRNEGWNGDADLFAYGPGYQHAERDVAELERLGF